MLDKLLQIGQEYYDFEILAFKNIDKSCCTEQECEVIDFDKVKENCMQKHSLNSIASCDAIRICPEQKRIDFIEMKGFEEYKRYNPNASASQIRKHIDKFDFEKKIKDSLYILQTIIRSDVFNASNSERDSFEKSSKRFFVVTDIDVKTDALKIFDLTMNFLATASSIDNEIKVCLETRVSEMEELCFLVEKPKLISCNKICKVICGAK